MISRYVPCPGCNYDILDRMGHKVRSPGIYGHTPKFYRGRVSYVGYLALVRKNGDFWNFWYMGNPYRPGKIIEKFSPPKA